MNLSLKHEPVPANAPRLAADIVEVARQVDGRKLDYTPQSLTVVDQIIQGFRSEGCSANEIKETLFGFGCYVGEVFVRAGGGRWRGPESEQEESAFGFPMIIELPAGVVCNPIGKVFK